MNAFTQSRLSQRTAQALAAVTAPADPVAKLRAEGRVTPAKAKLQNWPERVSGPYTPAQVDALLADSRGTCVRKLQTGA